MNQSKPISSQNPDRRLSALCRAVKNAGADAMLITDDITRRYLFRFPSTAGFGYVSERRCALYLDFRYYEKGCALREKGVIPRDVEVCALSGSMAAVLKKMVASDKPQKLLYEDRRMTCAAFSGLQKALSGLTELVPAGDLVERLRAVKDEEELSCILEAQRITDLAFDYIRGYIRCGMRERDIALEMEYFMRKNGADGLAFDTICVSGKKSSMPHGEPDETVVGKGFLTLDFGARYRGYCADMTRTLCIGTPDAEMKNIYDTVLAAQQAAFEKIHGGVIGSEVDRAARDVIEKAGYGDCFGHSTGHSLGLEIHESPNFSPREAEKVPSGAVISVEPGIYLEGKCGVRIEDIVFLTDFGYKNLTNSTKEFIILKES